MESTHWRDSEPIQRRDQRIGDVALRKLDLRSRLEMILANLVVLACFAPSGRRLGGRRRRVSKNKGRSCNGRSQKITPFHSSSRKIRDPRTHKIEALLKEYIQPVLFDECHFEAEAFCGGAFINSIKSLLNRGRSTSVCTWTS